MAPDAFYIERVEAERRRDAERRAAHWRQMRALPRKHGASWLRRFWRRLGLWSRVEDRRAVRARLQDYATR